MSGLAGTSQKLDVGEFTFLFLLRLQNGSLRRPRHNSLALKAFCCAIRLHSRALDCGFLLFFFSLLKLGRISHISIVASSRTMKKQAHLNATVVTCQVEENGDIFSHTVGLEFSFVVWLSCRCSLTCISLVMSFCFSKPFYRG